MLCVVWVWWAWLLGYLAVSYVWLKWTPCSPLLVTFLSLVVAFREDKKKMSTMKTEGRD